MFGKRPAAPGTLSPQPGPGLARPVSAPAVGVEPGPLTYERVLKSIQEDAWFYSRDIDARALMAAIEQDPYFLQKGQAQRLRDRLFKLVDASANPTMDYMFGILGAVAGSTCFFEAFEKGRRLAALQPDGKMPSNCMDIIGGADGITYSFGRFIDEILLEKDSSIWKQAGQAALRHGAQRMPDIQQIWSHVKSTFQKPSFGIPQYPFDQALGVKPITLVREMSHQLESVFLQVTRERMEKHQVFGFVIQDGIANRPGDVDPGFLAAMVMECAIPMAHVHPEQQAFGGPIPAWRNLHRNVNTVQ